MASMLNQAAVEALCSATYLDDYLECMENLPDDLQRVVSNLRELDSQIKVLMQDIAHHKGIYMETGDGTNKRRALLQIQRSLIKTQEIGDEKLQLVGIITDLIENRTRQLESDLENLDPGSTIPKKAEEPMITPIANKPKMAAPKEDKPSTSTENKAGLKRQRRQRAATEIKEDENAKKVDEKDKPKKKKKRIKKKETGSTPSPAPELIDPNEPLYCLCRQISYGEMIGCDYDDCEIEWFHFNCVALVNKPKGKWYCPNCRGDRPNVMKKGLKDHL